MLVRVEFTRIFCAQVFLHLLDLEEATWEHAQEGDFYLCNLNTSQVLLDNVCVKKKPSPYFQVQLIPLHTPVLFYVQEI